MRTKCEAPLVITTGGNREFGKGKGRQSEALSRLGEVEKGVVWGGGGKGGGGGLSVGWVWVGGGG